MKYSAVPGADQQLGGERTLLYKEVLSNDFTILQWFYLASRYAYVCTASKYGGESTLFYKEVLYNDFTLLRIPQTRVIYVICGILAD